MIEEILEASPGVWAGSGGKSLLYQGHRTLSGFAANVAIADDRSKRLGTTLAVSSVSGALRRWNVVVFGGVELIQLHVELQVGHVVLSCAAMDYQSVLPHFFDLIDLDRPTEQPPSLAPMERSRCRAVVSKPGELKAYSASLTADETVLGHLRGDQEIRIPPLATPGAMARLGFEPVGVSPQALPELAQTNLYDMHMVASKQCEGSARSVIWEGERRHGGLIIAWSDGFALYELSGLVADDSSTGELSATRVHTDPGSFWIQNMSPQIWPTEVAEFAS